MNLSIRELNELIYSLGIAAHHGNFVNKEVNESLLDKIYSELDKKIVEQEDEEGANYLISLDSTLKNVLGDANPLVDEIRSHFVSNEEVDEDAGYIPKRVVGVTQSILDYVEFMGEASYTEMQNYYRSKFGSNSFSHILISLVVPYKNRPTRRYLYKTASGKYVVRVAGLHNWIEKEY